MGCAITKSDDSVMPSTKSDTDFKARLEHKLYLARENPEPIFDLSECNLKVVPQGIFSLCKVFRKDVLLLYNNQLPSLDGGGSLNDLKLLIILDLHKNVFVHLNPAVNALENLRELYLNDNRLKDLPDSICELCNLEILNVNNNKIRTLPINMGHLLKLQQLYLLGNYNLTTLPYTLCRCRYLSELHIESEYISEPPSAITENGVTSIFKYFSEKYNIDYDLPDETDSKPVRIQNYHGKNNDVKLEEKITQLEMIKEQKLATYLALGQQNEESFKQELELQDAEKAKKDKFLKDLLDQQTKLELEVTKFQREKDEERKKLINLLMQVERKADAIVNQLLSLKNDPVYIGQCLEQERLEEERLLEVFRSEYDSLRKRDVLSAMEGLLRDESVRCELLTEYEMNKRAMTVDVLQKELESDNALREILQIQDEHQMNIVQKLQLDEQLQRLAVGALLERSDSRCWGLVQQVKLIEIQLAELTTIEIEKKRIQSDAQVNDIAEMRVNLSVLLMDLLAQQGQRRNQLLDTLKRMEDEEKNSDDFWLLQYQRLMDSLPRHFKDINANMDPILTSHLLSEGVIHCLPFLAKWVYNSANEDFLNISDSELLEAGVKNPLDRVSIMRAMRLYREEVDQAEKKLGHPVISLDPTRPTAPLLTPSCSNIQLEEISENSERDMTRLQYAECVICMDNDCQVIFIPCGHMCCCTKCSTPVELKTCPMCRAEIEQKIRVVMP